MAILDNNVRQTSRAWRGENLIRHEPLLFSVPSEDNHGTKKAKRWPWVATIGSPGWARPLECGCSAAVLDVNLSLRPDQRVLGQGARLSGLETCGPPHPPTRFRHALLVGSEGAATNQRKGNGLGTVSIMDRKP